VKFFESAFATLRKFADFKSRASREEFWLFFAFVLLAQFVGRLLDGLIGALLLFGPVSGLLGLLLLVPAVAVTVRRLHDVNRSGRDLIMLAAMVLAGPVLIGFGGGFIGRIVVMGLAGLTLLGFANLLLILTKKGSTIPNKYGAAPTAFSFATQG
jgi:uncharacterized membrane protein YhaH (DUF805 family)